MSGFAHYAAGAAEERDAIDAVLVGAHRDVDALRELLGKLRTLAGQRRGGGLVELDIGRALTALGAANTALERARRHLELT